MWKEEAEEYINKEPERVIKIRQLVVLPQKTYGISMRSGEKRNMKASYAI